MHFFKTGVTMRFFSAFSGLLMLLASISIEASRAAQGVTSNIHFLSSGIVLVYTDGSRSGIPACGQNPPARFALNSTTVGGRSQLAGLIAADAAKRKVVIVGSGDCGVYGDSETVNYFYIAD